MTATRKEILDDMLNVKDELIQKIVILIFQYDSGFGRPRDYVQLAKKLIRLVREAK